MVSGFFTSPKDRSRIFSGDEMEILIAEKCNGSFGLSKKLKKSSKFLSSLVGVILRHVPRTASVLFGLQEFHVKAERLELLDEDVERFRQPRLKGVPPLDDRL